MELTLQGTDGQETVSVDNLGKVLKIDEDTRVAPIAGDDVQITIDTDWQSAIYEILKATGGRYSSFRKLKHPRPLTLNVSQMPARYVFLFMMFTMHWFTTV